MNLIFSTSKMLRTLLVLVLMFICLGEGHAGTDLANAVATDADSQADVYGQFQNPPMRMRPFVRWWWNGNAVNEKEILRELDVMKAAGIGGVEINPVGLPEQANATGFQQLEWLSPEWTRMVRIAAEGCQARGMTVDLIVGSGWPFGGKFLKPEETIQAIAPNRIELEGPARFSRPLSEIMVLPKHRDSPKEMSEPRLHYARLYPRNAVGPADFIDVGSKVTKDNKLEFDIPAGDYVLHIGTWQRSHVGVTLGAIGADGPVLDHFNSTAVKAYLNRLSEALTREFGGPPGKYIRAMFCDSIELSSANWTTDLPQEFQRRRGYDLVPWLPFVLDSTRLPEAAKFADDVKRCRYDLSLTLVELFRERFIVPFHEWCHANGTIGRYQAYGGPWLMDMLNGYLLTDIPEGDTWIFPHPAVGEPLDSIRYAVWNKYASSGAHLTGKRVASCESMTNTDGVFRTTLGYIKQADDLNFMTGINHTVLHGFNYSPPEAGFPGWIRYGTYFSEQNPWWPYFHHWSDYNARLSSLLQVSKPVTKVAILGPTADAWSNHLLHRKPFIEQPHYLHKIWQALSSAGYGTDYVSESVVAKMQCSDGSLTYGPAKYDLLLVADVETLTSATITAMAKLADGGGRMLFVGKTPAKVAGMTSGSVTSDAEMAAQFREIKSRNQKSVTVISAPTTSTLLVEWVSRTMKELGITPDVALETPHNRLMQIHQKTGDGRDVFLFVNTSRDDFINTTASFPGIHGFPQRWDPETGTRSAYPLYHGGEHRQLRLSLRPLESLLLVFDEKELPGKPAALWAEKPEATMPLNAAWALELIPVMGPSTSITLESLVDFSVHPKLKEFAGKAVYTTTISVTNPEQWDALSLGNIEGVAEIKLNGKPVATQWYGKPLFNIGGMLKMGSNQIEINLTTTLFNYVRTLDDPVSRYWTGDRKGWNGGRNSQDPSLQPTGILGTVQLLQIKQ